MVNHQHVRYRLQKGCVYSPLHCTAEYLSIGRTSEKAGQPIYPGVAKLLEGGRGMIGNVGDFWLAGEMGLGISRFRGIPPAAAQSHQYRPPGSWLRCRSERQGRSYGPTVPPHLATILPYVRIGLMMDLSPMVQWSPHDPRIFLMLITTSNRRAHRMSILQNDSVASQLPLSRKLLFKILPYLVSQY